MKCRHECTNEKLPRMHECFVATNARMYYCHECTDEMSPRMHECFVATNARMYYCHECTNEKLPRMHECIIATNARMKSCHECTNEKLPWMHECFVAMNARMFCCHECTNCQKWSVVSQRVRTSQIINWRSEVWGQRSVGQTNQRINESTHCPRPEVRSQSSDLCRANKIML